MFVFSHTCIFYRRKMGHDQSHRIENACANRFPKRTSNEIERNDEGNNRNENMKSIKNERGKASQANEILTTCTVIMYFVQFCNFYSGVTFYRSLVSSMCIAWPRSTILVSTNELNLIGSNFRLFSPLILCGLKPHDGLHVWFNLMRFAVFCCAYT